MKVVIFVALCLFVTVKAKVLDFEENEPHIFNQEIPYPEEDAAPKPCCTPSQWEGDMGEFTGYYNRRYHHPGLAFLNGRLSYDAKGKRVAVIAQVPKRPPVKVIMDYGKHKIYMIFNGKHCKVSTTKKPFRPACIPKNAKYAASFYQGAGGAKLNENSWLVTAHGFTVSATVTKTGCIPTGEWVFGNARGVSMASSIGYVNITPGIKDPKVFTPPSFCKSVDEEDLNVGEEYPVLEYLRLKFQEE